MPKVYTISPDWTEQPWYNTGGTRAKKYMLSPDGKPFFFKRSQYREATSAKPGKYFKYEFWNEIIAYQLGILLGFKMLQYDIAIEGQIMGCISASMITLENQELNEGIKYIKAFSPDFDPDKKECRTWYTFALIENALSKAGLSSFINDIFELIIFDALIGNGDRHQENWAIISHQRLLPEVYEQIVKGQKSDLVAFLKRTVEKYKEKKIPIPNMLYVTKNDFAPIYDSGSSLGRELTDEAVELYLHSEDNMTQYVKRGLSEIHWENKKVTHFQLIRNLLDSPHQENIRKIMDRVINKYDSAKIEEILNEVDKDVPETLAGYRIPASRKQLILKIITLRFEMLKAQLNG